MTLNIFTFNENNQRHIYSECFEVKIIFTKGKNHQEKMHFVIAGIINCSQFSYAVMVAQRLKENLPGFTYLKIPKKANEWEEWLIKICKENEWYHTQSPLIWREIGLKQGKKDFIGDINRFFDLCYDYYGIPQDVLAAERFSKGEMDWFTKRTESEFFESVKLEATKRRKYRSRQVCITGASCQMTDIVIMELLQIDLQRREDGLEIRLFDEPTKEKKLAGVANDAKHCPGPSGFGNCRVVSTLKEAFSNIDLVIVLDSFSRKPKESVVKWLKRNRNAMCALGKALNLYAPAHCRVIIGSPSSQPNCYNATVLASFATKLHVRNIVVVTQDLGREMLRLLSKKTNVPLKDFYCPPVWGFVGLNKYVDVRRTLQTHLYKVPGKRVNSTIPQGVEEYELRTSECLISEDDAGELHIKISDHKMESYPQLGRYPSLAKATAIIDLLKVWGLKQEDGNGEILCLGVYSDGTFNIPQGIYWSQPVILKDGFWMPFADFPIPRSPHFDCYYLFMYSVAALYRTKVKPRIYISPKKILKPKDYKKFDFEKLTEKIGMPIIRTDTECAMYLKHLAKKELQIDLDEVIEYIKEEADSDILPKEDNITEQIYCECWRQELIELQKIVFDPSSTTEVEVDLTDNTSGSEWSIINPKVYTEIPKRGKERLEDALTEKGHTKMKKPTNKSPSSNTIGSVGHFSTGVVEVEKELFEQEKTSTEHFYKEQNAQIFDEDLKDPIYADTYAGEKGVSFDSDIKPNDETGLRFKFYGKKDAIRDEKFDLKMKKRISRYERGGEESVEDEEKSLGGKSSVDSWKARETADLKDTKFQITEEGASYNIIGDQNGLERLEEIRKSATDRESSTTSKKMYSDEIITSMHVRPFDDKKSTESSGKVSIVGEDSFTFRCSFNEFPEALGEKSDQFSLSLERDLESVWDEELFHEESMRESEEERYKAEKLKRKREGIPLCCLCRCIVPEGLPCCPCGASTVVEVLKKESVEVFIQSEDDVSYRVEYFETNLIQHPEGKKTASEVSVAIEEDQTPSKAIELPPESFLPFSPKSENKFMESARPSELTKEYIDFLKKKEKDIPLKCFELLKKAESQLKEKSLAEEEEKDKENDIEHEDEGNKKTKIINVEVKDEKLSPVCEKDEIKTDFSDIKLFLPCKLEDWRLTVQKKYREWFFQGPKIKDEAYYNIAIEDISEDEFEVDRELEQYFEK